MPLSSRLLKIGVTAAAVLWSSLCCAEPAQQCPPPQGVALQVLGSGGPIADDARASSSYLVWVDGESRVLIDAGGGAFLRFGEAQADFGALDFIGLSHFHTDHSADFPALLKSGYFSSREHPLRVAGPGAGGPFPGLSDFLSGLLDEDSGAYGYLSGYLDGSDGLVKIDAVEVGADVRSAVSLIDDGSGKISIDAFNVPHGIVPALAFRVRVRDMTIVFSSDQNGSNPSFTDFARHASALVMHMPVPGDASGAARRLHAPPGVIGDIARESGAEKLVLSHFMARSLRNLEQNLETIRARYSGPVLLASDLFCMLLEASD
jgi:ribonuclease BN (tRNA processing enzyme)